MHIKKIENIFKMRKASIMGQYKKSAVMILLEDIDGVLHIIFEVRAYTLRHQPGDICLPGGKVENGEEPKDAAIRETMEELNLNREDIEYIGEMDYFVTPYGSIMYPFIGKLKNKISSPNISEVDHIFKVPLKFFIENSPVWYKMDIGPRNIEDFPYELIRKGKDYKFSHGILNQYFYQYKDYVIWGFTARIVKEFIDMIADCQ